MRNGGAAYHHAENFRPTSHLCENESPVLADSSACWAHSRTAAQYAGSLVCRSLHSPRYSMLHTVSQEPLTSLLIWREFLCPRIVLTHVMPCHPRSPRKRLKAPVGHCTEVLPAAWLLSPRPTGCRPRQSHQQRHSESWLPPQSLPGPWPVLAWSTSAPFPPMLGASFSLPGQQQTSALKPCKEAILTQWRSMACCHGYHHCSGIYNCKRCSRGEDWCLSRKIESTFCFGRCSPASGRTSRTGRWLAPPRATLRDLVRSSCRSAWLSALSPLLLPAPKCCSRTCPSSLGSCTTPWVRWLIAETISMGTVYFAACTGRMKAH